MTKKGISTLAATLAMAAAAMDTSPRQDEYVITNPYQFDAAPSYYVTSKSFFRVKNQKQKRKAWRNNPRIRPLKNRR
jgi:hypothetical protein